MYVLKSEVGGNTIRKTAQIYDLIASGSAPQPLFFYLNPSLGLNSFPQFGFLFSLFPVPPFNHYPDTPATRARTSYTCRNTPTMETHLIVSQSKGTLGVAMTPRV